MLGIVVSAMVVMWLAATTRHMLFATKTAEEPTQEHVLDRAA
jgi:hypothetical protein